MRLCTRLRKLLEKGMLPSMTSLVVDREVPFKYCGRVSALGLPDERIYTALRFGLGRYNTQAEVEDVVAALAEAVKATRARSPAALP